MSLSKFKRRVACAWDRFYKHYFRHCSRMPWASNYGAMHEVLQVTVSVTPPPDGDEDDYGGGGVAIFRAFRRRNSYRRLLDRSGSVDVLLDTGRSVGGWRRLRKSASTDGGVGSDGGGDDGNSVGRRSPRSSVSSQLARLLDFRKISDSLGGERRRPPSRERTPVDGDLGCGMGSPISRRHRHRTRRRASSSASSTAPTSSPLRRVLQSFGSLYRTVSAEGSTQAPRVSPPPPPSARRILRTPAAYAYVRGLSGLATQRIPTKRSPRGCHPPCCSTVPIHFYVPGR